MSEFARANVHVGVGLVVGACGKSVILIGRIPSPCCAAINSNGNRSDASLSSLSMLHPLWRTFMPFFFFKSPHRGSINCQLPPEPPPVPPRLVFRCVLVERTDSLKHHHQLCEALLTLFSPYWDFTAQFKTVHSSFCLSCPLPWLFSAPCCFALPVAPFRGHK